MWYLSPGSCLFTYLRSFISSRLWSKKSLLFFIIFTQTSIPVCRSCACIALLNAADPRYSVTWYRPAMTEFRTTWKFLSSSKPVLRQQNNISLDNLLGKRKWYKLEGLLALVAWNSDYKISDVKISSQRMLWQWRCQSHNKGDTPH